MSAIKLKQISDPEVLRRSLHSRVPLKKLGKSKEVSDYTDRQINEMSHGVHTDIGQLRVDADYFIDVTKITSMGCVLEKVTYMQNPSLRDIETNRHNRIENIKTFYIKSYYLTTKEEFGGKFRHDITLYLYNLRALRKGRNEFIGLYGIGNIGEGKQYFKNGSFPVMLYYPLKLYINRLFFNNEYSIDDFTVETEIQLV